jgi:hypothetical protein
VSADPPRWARAEPSRLMRAQVQWDVSWLHLMAETGMDHATRRQLAAGAPVPLELVSAVARVLDIDPDDLLPEPPTP